MIITVAGITIAVPLDCTAPALVVCIIVAGMLVVYVLAAVELMRTYLRLRGQ